jgi:hypothetical protein
LHLIKRLKQRTSKSEGRTLVGNHRSVGNPTVGE